MGLHPFKIKTACGIYLWTKKEEKNNEQHRFFFISSATEVVSSAIDDLFEMHGFLEDRKELLAVSSKQQLPSLYTVAENTSAEHVGHHLSSTVLFYKTDPEVEDI